MAGVTGLTTDEVVAALLDVARALDRRPKRVSRADAAPPPATGGDGDHPGHRYTRAVGWADVLGPHGWEPVREVGGVDNLSMLGSVASLIGADTARADLMAGRGFRAQALLAAIRKVIETP